MKTIKELIAAFKAKEMEKKANELRAQFRVDERNGFVWLTHNGVAIIKFDDAVTADNISAMIESARKTATSFARL